MTTPRATLDTNALIDLDPETPLTNPVRRRALQALVDLHRQRRVLVCVPAIIASERQQGKVYLRDFGEFQKRLIRCGLEDAEILRTLGRYGMAYYDWFVWADDAGVALERQLHDVLFPQIEYEYSDYASARRLDLNDELDHGWRNPRCDVLAMWSHIRYTGDVFVTSDDVFHSREKNAVLLAMGAKSIARPGEAMELLKLNA